MGYKKSISKFFLTVFCTFSLIGFSQSQKFKVALDAGHGGRDFGAVYTGHVEKAIALAVAVKVGKILESTPGFEVIYTRKSDVFIELNERANIANRADSHIFVSIHCNANNNTRAYGTETYVMGMSKNASNLEAAKKENAVITMEKDYQQKYEGFDPTKPESMIGLTMMQEEYLENSIALASKIQDIFTDALGKKSRGVKQAPFWVLHKAYMPRVLVEMGFISNPTEGAYLDSERGQNETARAIADAIISYRNEYFGTGTEAVQKPSQKIVEPVVKPSPDDTIVPQKAIVQNPVTKQPEVKPAGPGVTFKVQLAVSSTKLDLTPSNFNGLGSLSMLTANGLYKYMYGESDDYNEARRLMQEARTRGYESAFVIAFRDGKKISIQEALTPTTKR